MMTRILSKNYVSLVTFIVFCVFQITPLKAGETCIYLENSANGQKGLSAKQQFNLAECYFQINEQNEIEGSLPKDFEAGLHALRLSADGNFQPALLLLGDAYQHGFWDSEIDFDKAIRTYERAVQNASKQSLSQISIERAKIKYAQLGIQAYQWTIDRTKKEKEVFVKSYRYFEELVFKYSRPYGKSLFITDVVEFSELCARVNFDSDIRISLSNLALSKENKKSSEVLGALCLLNFVGSDYGIEEFRRVMQHDWALEVPPTAWAPAITALEAVALDDARVDEVPRITGYSDDEILSFISTILAHDRLSGFSKNRSISDAFAPLNRLAERGNAIAAGAISLIYLSEIQNGLLGIEPGEIDLHENKLRDLSAKAAGFDAAFLDFTIGLLSQFERYKAIERGGSDNVIKNEDSEEAMNRFKSSFEKLGSTIINTGGLNQDINSEQLEPVISLMAQFYVLSSLSPRNPIEFQYPDAPLAHAADIYEEISESDALKRLIEAAQKWDEEMDEEFMPMAWFEKELILGRFDVLPVWGVFSYYFSDVNPFSAKLYEHLVANLCQKYCLLVTERKLAARVVSNGFDAPVAFRGQIDERLELYELLIDSNEGIMYLRENLPAYYEADTSGKGRKYALIIANSDYSQLPPLRSPQNDAARFKSLLSKKFGFEVTVVANAKRTNIMEAIIATVSEVGENDQFILFYAGHGEVIDTTNYWVPINASAASEVDWISEDFIKRKLRSAKSKNILVIVDSCFSGTITRGVSIGKRDLNAAAISEFKSRTSRMALTSGGNEKVLDGGAGKHSVFTGALLNFMESSEKPFTGAEMHSAIRSVVLKQSIAYGGKQIPQYEPLLRAGHEGGDFVFEPITEKK